MCDRQCHLSPLEARKQLLIVESEINRVQLVQEWHTLAHGVRDVAQRTKSIGTWASAAGLLVAGVAALRCGVTAPATAKRSWFQKILNLARVASTIWFAYRARGGGEAHNR